MGCATSRDGKSFFNKLFVSDIEIEDTPVLDVYKPDPYAIIRSIHRGIGHIDELHFQQVHNIIILENCDETYDECVRIINIINREK